jgi:hypothetical protein
MTEAQAVQRFKARAYFTSGRVLTFYAPSADEAAGVAARLLDPDKNEEVKWIDMLGWEGEGALDVTDEKATGCIHGRPACDDCIAHDTMLHMST